MLRWLDLDKDEVLFCEDDEDLDRLLRHGEGISEQVKSYTGELNIRDRAVMESLRGFLLTYVVLRRDRHETRRFVFTTTARRRRQRTHDLGVDVLESWHDADKREAVVAALRKLLPLEQDDAAGRSTSGSAPLSATLSPPAGAARDGSTP